MSHPLAKPEDRACAPLTAEFPSSGAESLPHVEMFLGLEELPERFLDLFEEAGRQCVFLTLPWFQNFTKTAMAPDEHLRIYGVSSKEKDGTPAAMMLLRGSSNPKSLLHPRKLDALANYYSCLYAPHLNAASAEPKEALGAITRAIAQERPRWDAIEINPLEVDSKHFSELVEAFREAGFVVQTYFSFGNWFLPVKGRSFLQYAESLPSVLRNTLHRKRKKLEKTGRAKIEIVTGGNKLGDAIDAYVKVYRASWKQAEPYPNFIPGLIRTCAATGALRLGILEIDGEPAAAQLWIVHNGKALIYKLAYDERFGDFSAGTILSATLFQHALDVDKVNEVDYLSGDDAYKRDWMSQRRERWGILALNPRTPRGAVAIARHIGGRALKHAALSLAARFKRRKAPDHTKEARNSN